MTLSEELQWRGFIQQTTLENPAALDKKSYTFYFGVDPSSDSMTIGNLASMMLVKHMIKHNHKAYLLIGGATGLIGDPDGKKDERNLKEQSEIEENSKSIVTQYKTVLSNLPFSVVNNYDWFKDIYFVDFLRNVGKHVPMRQMLARDFVETRLSEDGSGISYAEFSYVLIQGYDFVHLNKEYGVNLQLCGSDQWGNSIAGVDLNRRMNQSETHVLSMPLVINKTTGKKFGKTEDGAIWLDENKTSVFKFYQFWINVDDDGALDYLKIYTDLDRDMIDEIMDAHNEARSNRLAQKKLAYEVTRTVHGEVRAESVERMTEILFGGGHYTDLTQHDMQELSKELQTVDVSIGDQLLDVLLHSGLAISKREGREFLSANAIYVNGEQLPLEKATIESSDSIHGYTVLRRGKNKISLLKLK